MKHYAALSSDVAKKELENIELKKVLVVRGDEVYVQRPSLPQHKVSPKHSVVVLIAVVVSGFVLLMFVLIRKSWISALQDAETASKLASIKRSLGL